MDENALVPLAALSNAEAMLAAATTIEELRQVHDLAALAGELARTARLGRDAQNEAARMRLEAEARAADAVSHGGR